MSNSCALRLKVFSSFLVFVLFSSVAPSALADNLLLNGGFESPVVPATSMCGPYADCIGYRNGVGDSIGGWLVIGTSGLDAMGNPIPNTPSPVMLLGYNYVEPNNATGATLNFHPQSGLQAVDLTGEGNQGPTNGIKQSVGTTVGQQYLLSFWVGHQYDQAPGYENGPANVGLWIDSSLIGLFGNSDNTLNDISWRYFQYSFTANSSSTVIAFLNATDYGNNYAGLDNVSLTPVPEPTTITLLATGAVSLFSFGRRRRI